MSRFARPPKVRQRTRQGSLHSLFVIAAFLTLGLFLNGKYVTWRQHAAPVAIAPSDDEIYTGSILFMPTLRLMTSERFIGVVLLCGVAVVVIAFLLPASAQC
jgi:hypothetical protein